MKLCYIGLGVMGFPMAAHLARKIEHFSVYNRSAEKCQLWNRQFPSHQSSTQLTDIIQDCDVIISCIGNDNDLRQIAYQTQGILDIAKSGAIWVDHTTTSLHVVKELHHACLNKGIHFVDAPVSGGQIGAEKGQLSIMLGGDTDAIAQIQPILSHYARQITHVGPSGSGQLTKMVNQICLAGLIQALSEGLNFAKAAGLDTDAVLSAIGNGAAQSWQMDNRAKTMCQGEFDFGFAVNWMRKDLGICLDQARSIGASLPVTALVDQFYADLQQQGEGRLDTSSLIKRLSVTPKVRHPERSEGSQID